MTEEYYAYATGNRKTHFGLQYNAYGIYAFKSREKAEQDAKRTLHFANSKDLEVIIVDITPLVQTGIISEEKLQIRD